MIYSRFSGGVRRLLRPANATDTLTAGSSLRLGESLWSSNGGYRLTLQDDGNLVLRSASAEKGELWASGTFGKGVVEARLQGDGNFVLYTASGQSVIGTGQNGVKIPSATSGANVSLVLQDDGNAVIYSSTGQDLWSTKTSQSVDLTAPEWRWWNELQGTSWNSAVTGLVPVSLSATSKGQVVFQQGVVVGLQNGAVEQWSGSGGQQEWVELAGLGGGAGAYSAFNDGTLLDFSKWKCADGRCTIPTNTLKAGVEFAEALSPGGVLQSWGIQGGIGSDSDPIFKNPDLKSGSPVAGAYEALAFYKKISPDKYTYKNPEASEINFDGYIQIGNNKYVGFESTPGQNYNILFAKKAGTNSIGQILEPDTVVS